MQISTMIQHASPILNTILDTDAYKLHMQQAVFHRYNTVSVAAEFRCRTEDNLGIYASEIREQVQGMQQLKLTDQEYRYLASLPFFTVNYLNWLRDFRYQPQQVSVQNHQGKLVITLNGLWSEIILWEVPLLALISETIHRHQTPAIGVEQALQQLDLKLNRFDYQAADTDLSRFKVIDFGTRRRYSRQIQYAIVSTLKQRVNWLIGSSNYDICRQLNLTPLGTQAHEWFQAHQQISQELAQSQSAALQAWLEEYDDRLGIALTDCISTDAFLRDFGFHFASRYQGVRHDSGDPVAWGEKMIKHYQSLDIDPSQKTLIFSDNLSLEKALKLYRHFDQRIQLAFGIGTQLTCDIAGVTPLNIVIKLVSCNGKPVAKLSDSPGKMICRDPDFITDLEKAFQLTPGSHASHLIT